MRSCVVKLTPTLGGLVIVLLLILTACGSAKVQVQPARATWDTGYFQEAVYSLALEELGFKVLDHKEMDNPIFYREIAEGSVHFWANGWFPLHDQYKDFIKDKATLAGDVVVAGALQGYLIDKAGPTNLASSPWNLNVSDSPPEATAGASNDGVGEVVLDRLTAVPPGCVH